MKNRLSFLLLALVLGGCGTVSTIERRTLEKGAAFTGATPAQQRLMRHGSIARDFTVDMVYVALDQPDRVNREPGGRIERWFYYNFGRNPAAPYVGGTRVDNVNANFTPKVSSRSYYPNAYNTRADPSQAVDVWQKHLVVTFLDGKVATVELFQM